MIQQWVGGHNGAVVCQSQTLGEREIIGARYRGRNIFRVGNFSLEKIGRSNKNGQKLKGSESLLWSDLRGMKLLQSCE